MVNSWDDSDRRHLADLIREDDRLRAEHAEWNAQRERAAASLVRESEADCLLYREHEYSVPAPAPAPDAELLTDAQVDALADVLVIERQRARDERAAEIAKLREEIAELRGYVKAMHDQRQERRPKTRNKRAGKSETVSNSGEADVVDLPNWRRTDAA
jgi:hypothetical protein